MAFRFIILCALLLSCATDHSQKLITKNEAPPFLKRYKKKNKELFYIAIDEKGNVDDPTMNLIRQAVKKFDPEIIVTKYPVEGENRLEVDLSQCEQNQGCGASAWTCLMARPRGIPCLSGEPFHSEILKRAKSKEVHSDEILFFYTFRELVRKMKGKKSPLDGLAKILEEEKRVLNMVSPLDADEFIRMYRDKMNSRTILVGKNEIRPNAGGHYIQRLAKLIEETKERLILEKIEKEQLDHERVMVVYGIEHYERHKVQLEDFFSTHLP